MNALISTSGGTGTAQPKSSARMVGKLGLGALALGTALAMGAPAAQATFNSGLVDLQFVGNTNGSGPTASGAAVIGSSGDVWNQIVGATDSATYAGPNVPLRLVNGSTSSGAYLTISNENTTPQAYVVDYPGSQTTQNSADYGLLASDLVAYVDTPIQAASISGLNTSLTYNLYLYNAWNNGTSGLGTKYTVTGATTPASQTINPTNAGATFVSGENYVKFTLSPNTSGIITVDMISSDTKTSGQALLSGFQLQAVPEPASLGLLAIGGLGLLLVGRKRRLA